MKKITSLKIPTLFSSQFLLREKGLYILNLFAGLILSSPTVYFIPESRPIFIGFILLFSITTLLKNYFKQEKIFIFQAGLIFIISLQLLLNQMRDYGADLAPFISMLIGSFFLKNHEQILKILKIIIIINFMIMLYESYREEYFIPLYADYRYEYGRMQGLFSYSKETGFFLLSAFLFFRYFSNSTFLKFIISLSAILSGTRTAIIFIFMITIIDYLYYAHRKINKNTIKIYLSVTILAVIFMLFLSFYITENNEYMLVRILNSFDFETSSHQDRLYFWEQYIYQISNYSMFEFLFGKGMFLNYFIGNGAENAYLQILSQTGILGLMVFLFPLIIVTSFLLRNPLRFYPIFLLLFFFSVGRIATGWADGILIWIVIFYLINNHFYSSTNQFKAYYQNMPSKTDK